MEKMILDYQLNKEEMEDALWRLTGGDRQKKLKKVFNAIFTILGIIVVIAYSYSQELLYALILLFIIVFVFYISIGPRLQWKRKIQKYEDEKSWYHLEVESFHLLYGSGEKKTELEVRGEFIEFYDYLGVYMIRVRGIIIVVPKRALKNDQGDKLVSWALSNVAEMKV